MIADCKKCKRDSLIFAKGLCNSCYVRSRQLLNIDRVRATQKKYYETHKLEKAKYGKEWRKLNPDYYKKYYHNKKKLITTIKKS